MATIEVRDAATDELLGSTRTHDVPRIGEAIDWRQGLWRVLDLVHPTQDVSGLPIFVPCVFVAQIRKLGNDADD